jgi:hypothetical protein
MNKTFKISTNIERDSNSDLNYIVTKNANEVYDRIIYNHSRGQNSFTIIGSYGTGKSSFLWAFEKHLSGRLFFEKPVNGEFKGVSKFDFIKIVGEPSSFKERFCSKFNIQIDSKTSNKEVLKDFDAYYKSIEKKKQALVLIIDEFGKHLEFIAKERDEDMYFIQELAEYCNDATKQILFITTLHQNITAYSKGLSKTQKNEWNKVRGRLVEIAFDEPVEQLLFFAAERLKEINVPNEASRELKSLIKVILESNLLGKRVSENAEIFLNLYPLDPLSADLLTKSLQRYGQNERSLFTFLESPELTTKTLNGGFFSVADCFDYLIANLSSEIEDGEKNPFKAQWKAAIVAIEKAEFLFESDFHGASQILKTICLANIFSNQGGSLDHEFIESYSRSILLIDEPLKILDVLVKQNIVKFSNHRNKFNFTDGTDVDIEQELINATRHIENEINVVNRLKAIYDFDIIPAKRVQYKFGTPRFFKYKFWDEINCLESKDEIDGYINLIFSNKVSVTEIIQQSKISPEINLFVLFDNVQIIEELLFAIDKINYVIEKNSEDKVAKRILNEEKLFKQNQLEKVVRQSLFNSNQEVKWVYRGEQLSIYSEKQLNQFLSTISEEVYSNTPIFKNEMVNKEVLSTPVLTARKALIRQMINKGNMPNLGFEENLFPPEKTIYLSLLKHTGIHKETAGSWSYSAPHNESFVPLWEKSEEFLFESSNSKRLISELYVALKKAPFKLKQGFLDFWIPIFLIVKKEDYSLYSSEGEYIPHLTPEVMDIIYKSPSKFLIKGLATEGVKNDYYNFYKELVDYNESNVTGLESSYITIYSNFLKFYRGLEDYSKRTKQLPKSARGVRDAISKAKDPESALFEDIPSALGFHGVISSKKDRKIEDFLSELKLAIKQIRQAYDDLISSIESTVLEHLNISERDFKKYKPLIQEKFSTINRNAITNDQIKLFHARAVSPLDVKKAYWESLTDAVIGKKLDKINDEELPNLLERFKSIFSNLIDLIDLHSVKLNDNESIVQFNILHSDGKSNIKRNIVIPDKLQKEIEEQEMKLKDVFSNNSEINKIALLRLLEQELNKK